MSSGQNQINPCFGVTRTVLGKGRRLGTKTENIKVSQFDIKTRAGEAGELAFNGSGLYYCDGKEWVSIAKTSDDLSKYISVNEEGTAILTAPGGDLNLSCESGKEKGGDIYISSGEGQVDNGEIYFDVGKKQALMIKNNGDLIIKAGDIEFGRSTSGVKYTISQSKIDAVSEEGELPTLPDVTMSGLCGVLSVNLDLQENEEVSGVIKNKMITKNSWISLTAATDGGIPQVWISSPEKGHVKYHIYCASGFLSNVRLYIDIRRSS